MLVVLVIVGILVSLLTLSVGLIGEDSQMQRETERLESLLTIASEETMLHGYEMGLRFYRQSYEFSIFREESDEWVPLSDDRMFRRRKMPEVIELDLEIEGREVVLEFEPDKKETHDPQVFILSSGDITPFRVRVREAFENDGYRLTVEPDGSAEIENENDAI